MAHVREQIRSAVVTAVSGLTTTGARVYESRVLPLEATSLPALCVYTRSDTPSYDDGRMNAIPARVLDIHIEGYCRGDDQSVLDDIAAEVETAMAGSTTVRAFGPMWLGAQEMRVDGEGEALVSVIDMAWTLHYSTAEGAPSVAV